MIKWFVILTTLKFSKAVFCKFYLVYSWTLCLDYRKQRKEITYHITVSKCPATIRISLASVSFQSIYHIVPITVPTTPWYEWQLTLSRRRPLSYRNQSTDFQSKSKDWFLYDNGLRHERVNAERQQLPLHTAHIAAREKI